MASETDSGEEDIVKALRIREVVMALLGAALLIGVAAAAAPQVPLMPKEELKSLLGNPNVIVIDVRIGFDWNESDSKIKGAVRENPYQIGTWLHKYPKDKTLVLYCA
jgi:rhodanese-related sulfurtransferase